MKKQHILDKLERAWMAFNDSFAGLSDEQMLQTGVCGAWSVKDILAHVGIWEGESLKHLPMILQGERPASYRRLYGGIDAFNAMMIEEWRGHSLAEVRQQLEETHHKLIVYLQGVPDEQFATETRFRRRLGWDSYRHYPLHTQGIREWCERSGIA
jgi:hypothetical protein